jgi:hypothetical protein
MAGAGGPGSNAGDVSVSYYFSKTVHMSMEEAIAHVTAALAQKGFGVLTTIHVRATLKKKLDVDFHPYTILGACNPTFAVFRLVPYRFESPFRLSSPFCIARRIALSSWAPVQNFPPFQGK